MPPPALRTLLALLSLLCAGAGGFDEPSRLPKFARRLSEQTVSPPILTWLYPPKGHVAGGTLLTIHGAGVCPPAALPLPEMGKRGMKWGRGTAPP